MSQSPSVAVYRSELNARCLEHALVLRVADIDCEVMDEEGGCVVLVQPGDMDRAQEQLELYVCENSSEPTSLPPVRHVSNGIHGVLVYVAILVLVDLLQRQHGFSVDWREAGKAQAALILQGEWWRTVTALSLHADPVHLAGNLGFGILFGLFAGQLLGSGLAWISILVAGAAGNAINAMVQSPAHTSVGASTAVFAALGIVTFFTWKTRVRAKHRAAYRWAPIVGALVLLGYLGMSGERTDVVAHVTGLTSGAAVGMIFGSVADRLTTKSHYQLLLGLGAVAAFTFAWTLAVISYVPVT